MEHKRLFLAGSVIALLAVAGCGTKTSDGSAPAADGSPIVSVRDIAGIGTTLVNGAGDTLYFADQEAGGSIHCVDACVRFWMPLTVSADATPTAGSGVSGTIATIDRPDGSVQVTYNGQPLYTFADDGGPGHADGNGVTDSFNGTTFLWHATTATGSAPTATPSAGGYGY